MAEKSGGKVVPLLLLLAILAGGGAWNYKRNTEIEDAEPRPYRGYSDADLRTLADAHAGEIEGVSRKLQAHTAGGVRVRDRALLGGQVDEFERVQKISSRTRAIAGQIRDHEIAREQIEFELARRAQDRPAYKLVLRRVFTFDAI